MAARTIIKAYRGPAASLPTLEAGQLGWTTDTEILYVGDGVLNHMVMMGSVHVHQHSHPFVAGDAIYCSGANAYTKAKADVAATSDVVGVVSVDVGTDDFIYCVSGKMTTGVPAVAAGSVLFLSDTTAGALTTTEPTAVGHISLLVAVVLENAVSMIVYSWRGVEIGTAGSGDVIGPAGATSGNLALFDGATGKLIKDGGAIPAAGFPTTGGTMTGNLIMDNMDITLVKLLTLHGEIDDGNSGTADTIDWNTGAAHKSTLTGNVTLAFVEDINLSIGATATADGYTDPRLPSFAIDGDPDTWWRYNANVPHWLRVTLGTAGGVGSYALIANASFYPKAWILKGSNDGNSWTTLDAVTTTTILSDGASHTFSIDSPASYLIYQLDISEQSDPGYIFVCEFKLFSTTGTLNPAAPCFLTLKLVQDGTGGRTVTWPATVKGTVTLDAAASATTIVQLYWDGTYYWVVRVATF